MDAPLLTEHELIRPWRRATLVASLVAAVELVLLVGVGAVLVAKPLARSVQLHAEAHAFAPAKQTRRGAEDVRRRAAEARATGDAASSS